MAKQKKKKTKETLTEQPQIKNEASSNPWIGLIAIAAGTMPLGIGIGFLQTKPGSVHAPLWLLAVAGSIFMLAGTSIICQYFGFKPNSLPQKALAALIILGFLLIPCQLIFHSSASNSLLYCLPVWLILMFGLLKLRASGK